MARPWCISYPAARAGNCAWSCKAVCVFLDRLDAVRGAPLSAHQTGQTRYGRVLWKVMRNASEKIAPNPLMDLCKALLNFDFQPGACRAFHCCAGQPTRVMGQCSPRNPDRYVQDKAASSGSSFYYAFLFLPKERRAAITAFYAFLPRSGMTWSTRSRTRRGQPPSWPGGRPRHKGIYQPVRSSRDAGTRCLTPRPMASKSAICRAVIEGCQMDLDQTRYLDFAPVRSATAIWSPAWW